MVLTAAELAEYQEYVTLALVHTYTRSAVSAGSEDSWKMAPPTYAAGVSGVPCNYVADGALATRERIVAQVDTPTIMVSKDDTIKVGDKVTDIRDSNGTIVLAGPLFVEYKAPAMGFGPVTNYIVSLNGTAPKEW